jgi:hypothetical protein
MHQGSIEISQSDISIIIIYRFSSNRKINTTSKPSKQYERTGKRIQLAKIQRSAILHHTEGPRIILHSYMESGRGYCLAYALSYNYKVKYEYELSPLRIN